MCTNMHKCTFVYDLRNSGVDYKLILGLFCLFVQKSCQKNLKSFLKNRQVFRVFTKNNRNSVKSWIFNSSKKIVDRNRKVLISFLILFLFKIKMLTQSFEIQGPYCDDYRQSSYVKLPINSICKCPVDEWYNSNV